MKRLFILFIATALTALALGLLRAKERGLASSYASLLARQTEMTNAVVSSQAERAALRKAISAQQEQILLASQQPNFSHALQDWLLGGSFSEIPDSLLPELRSKLMLPSSVSPDFVLISKATLRVLEPPSPGPEDKLSDSLSALLALSAEQRMEIENTLSDSRREFLDWAKRSLQREGPEGNTLVRYTLPAMTEPAESITNRFMQKLAGIIGQQRTDAFLAFANTWFQFETSWLGSGVNTLTVLRQTAKDGQPGFVYELDRRGPHSVVGQGPSPITPGFIPPPWNTVFPGGWNEIARREGFELPPPGSANVRH